MSRPHVRKWVFWVVALILAAHLLVLAPTIYAREVLGLRYGFDQFAATVYCKTEEFLGRSCAAEPEYPSAPFDRKESAPFALTKKETLAGEIPESLPLLSLTQPTTLDDDAILFNVLKIQGETLSLLEEQFDFLDRRIVNVLDLDDGEDNDPSGLTGPVGVGDAGTGITSYTTGDLLYASGAAALSKLAIGSDGQVLTVTGGLPVWADASGGGGGSSNVAAFFNATSSSATSTFAGNISVATDKHFAINGVPVLGAVDSKLYIGLNNTITGDVDDALPTAVGYYNDVSGTSAFAVGGYNTVSGDYSYAFGGYNTASGNYASAFGLSNTASMSRASVFGYNNTASGYQSVVVGYNNTSQGTSDSTFGVGNLAFGGESIAAGYVNTASGSSSSAFGYYNVASANYASAFGNRITNNIANSTMIGPSNAAKLTILSTGETQAPFFSATSSSATSTFAGNISIATGKEYLVAGVGILSRAANGAILAGDLSGNARGANAIDVQTRIGNPSEIASGDNASAFGRRNEASGTGASSFGYSNTASATYATAFGFTNSAGGELSAAFGVNNTADGAYSAAAGYFNRATADYSVAFGHDNVASANYASAFGNGITNNIANSTMIGPSNAAKLTILSTGEVQGSYFTATSTTATSTFANGINLTDGCFAINGTCLTPGGGGSSPWDDNGSWLSPASGEFIDVSHIVATSSSATSTFAGNISVATDKHFAINGNAFAGITVSGSGVYLGTGNTATGSQSISLGINNNAGGSQSLVSGYLNEAMGPWTAALGFNNRATGDASSAIGYKNNALGSYFNSAFGHYNTASNYGDVAFGAYNTASGGESIAFGSRNTASAYGAAAFGRNITNNIADSIMIGPSNAAKLTILSTGETQASFFSATSSSATSTFAGNISVASGKHFSIAGNPILGYQTGFFTGAGNVASAGNTFSSGNLNTASAVYASAVGFYNTADASSAQAFGAYNTASGYYSSALGYYNEATAEQAVAVGGYNIASGRDSAALGLGNDATARFASAAGYNNSAVDYMASSFGYSNTASATNTSAFGYDNTASTYNASAFGFSNSASGLNSGAFGYNNTVSANDAFAFGGNITNNIATSTIIGPTNSANIIVRTLPGESSLAVGIGTSTPTAQLHTDGTLRFSNFGAGTLETDALGNVSVASDERLKDIQGDFGRGLDAVLEIDPIMYRWNDESGYETKTIYSGFSAQDVNEVIPEAIGESPNGFLTLSDRPILAAVVNALKEVWDVVTGNRERIEKLEQEMHELREELDEVRGELDLDKESTTNVSHGNRDNNGDEGDKEDTFVDDGDSEEGDKGGEGDDHESAEAVEGVDAEEGELEDDEVDEAEEDDPVSDETVDDLKSKDNEEDEEVEDVDKSEEDPAGGAETEEESVDETDGEVVTTG